MGRRIRHFETDGIYFVTNRCTGSRFLLRPSSELNRVIRGALAKYSSRFDIELFGWVFMSNHFHLIVRSQEQKIPQFMRDFQSDVSAEVKRMTGWDARVFEQRYDAEPILDDAALAERLEYVAMNPVRADLVAHPSDWPGVCSYDLHASGEDGEAHYLDRTRLGRLEREADGAVDPQRAMETHPLEWTKPPALEDCSKPEAGERMLKDIDGLCETRAEKRRSRGDSVLGAEGVRRQSPRKKPDEIDRSPEPLCHTTDPEKLEAHREHRRRVATSYRTALQAWRAGETDVSFPTGTYPPGWLHPARAGPP
ncbi:MAG: transposase [Bradymonadaceae bacterium]